MKLTSKRNISVVVLILLSVQLAQGLNFQVYTQLNEKVRVELYDQVKTVRSQVDVLQQSTNVYVSSGADLVSAVKISTKANAGKVVTSAQLQVSPTAQVRIEVTTSDNQNYLFSYQLVTLQTDNSIQTTVTATSALTLTATGVLNEVSFSTATQGYFSVNAPDNKNANLIGSFAYSDTQGLSVSTTKIGFSVNQIKAYYFGGQQYLVAITSNSLGLVTPTAEEGYDWSSLSSLSNEECLSGNYVLSLLYPLLFCQTSTDSYQISAFYLLNNQLTQVDYTLPQLSSAQFSNIIGTTSLNGVIFILSSDILDINNSSLYISKVLLNESSGQLTVQSFNIIVPQGYLGLSLPIYVQPSNLLVCFTETTVLGYNIITGQLLFERITYSQQGFKLLEVISYQSTYQLVYINNQSSLTINYLATIQYLMSIPAITFTQTTSYSQIYQLGLSFGLQQLTVYSQLLSDGKQQFSVNNFYMYTNTLVSANSLKASLNYNIEEQFIGSNLKLSIQQVWTGDEFNRLQYGIESISQLTNQLTVKINGVKSSNFDIYPTQGNSLLVVSSSSTYLAGIVLKNYQYTLSTLCQENVLGALIKKDINGLYSYSGSSLTQQISLPFQQSAAGQSNCLFSSITTTCQKKDTNNQDIPFLFTSDVLQAKVFSLCNSELTIYTYKATPFSLASTPTTVSLTLKAASTQMLAISGKLFITDSSTYVVIYNYNVFPGYSQTISIPQTLGTISNLILYSSSYLLIVTAAVGGSPVVYQLPYEDNATPLRSLQLFGYTPNFLSAVPLYQTLQLGTVLNEAQALPQMQEYYILPVSNKTSTQSILVFRLNLVTAQNQLYKILDLKATLNQNRIFASNAGFLGFVDSKNNGYLYSLNYWTSFVIDVQMNSAKAFLTQPCQFLYAILQQTSSVYFLPYVTFQKDVSAANAVINQDDQNVVGLIDYYAQFISLTEAETTQVDLTSSVSSNVFGWIPSQKGLNSPVFPLVTNRIVAVDQPFQIKGLFDALYFLQEVTIVSYNSTVDVSNVPINVLYQDPQLFYDPSTMTSTYNDDDNSTTIVVYIYSVASDYVNLKQSLFSLRLTANYDPQYAGPSLGMYSDTVVRTAPELDPEETITRVQSDPILGLFLLKKIKQSNTQTLCLLTVTSDTFTQDCDSVDFINSLGILDAIWIPILKINIFVSANGVIYSGLTKTGISTSFFSFDLTGITSTVPFAQNSKTLVFAGSIRANCILVSYDGINALEFSILQIQYSSSDPFTVQLQNVFFGENNLKLTGQGAVLSQTETLLLATDFENNLVYSLIYSDYSGNPPQSNDRSYNILRASSGQAVEDVTALSGQAKISQFDAQSNSLRILLNSYPGKNPKESTLTINPEITVTIVSLNSTDFVGVGTYLNLEGTVMNQSNSIPINIDLDSSYHPHSSLFQIAFAFWTIMLFVMML